MSKVLKMRRNTPAETSSLRDTAIQGLGVFTPMVDTLAKIAKESAKSIIKL